MDKRKEPERKIGDIYIEPGGCPECGADLEVRYAVSVMCVNWQHPHIKGAYRLGGKRDCDYALMSG